MEEHALYRVLMVEDDRGIAQAVQRPRASFGIWRCGRCRTCGM